MEQEQAVTLTPRPVEALRGIAVKQLACGSYHAAALDFCGDLYTWGSEGGGTEGDYRGHGGWNRVSPDAEPRRVEVWLCMVLITVS